MDQPPPSIKVVIVGDGLIGKTSLLISYANDGRFVEQHVPTVLDTYAATILAHGMPYSLHLYDTAGQEEYDRLRCLTYPDTDVFLVCYSVVSSSSYQNAEELWIPEINFQCPHTPFILVGLKCDLRHDALMLQQAEQDQEHVLAYEQGVALANKCGALCYMECSAKLNHGVKEVFDMAVERFVMGESEGDDTDTANTSCSFMRSGGGQNMRKRHVLKYIRNRLRQCAVS